LAGAITTTGYRIVNAVVAYPRRVILTGNRVKNHMAIPWSPFRRSTATRILFAVILNQLGM
jgi:hypothetical protein